MSMFRSSDLVLSNDGAQLGFIREFNIKVSSDQLGMFAETKNINNEVESWMVQSIEHIKNKVHIDLRSPSANSSEIIDLRDTHK